MTAFEIPAPVLFHELGHLVAAVATRSPFTHVKVVAVLGGGEVGYDPPIRWSGPIPEVPLLLFLAGPVAQRLYAPQSVKYGLLTAPLFTMDKARSPGWEALGALVSRQDVGWGYDLGHLYEALASMTAPEIQSAEVSRFSASEAKLEGFFRQHVTALAIETLFSPLQTRQVLVRSELLERLQGLPALPTLP